MNLTEETLLKIEKYLNDTMTLNEKEAFEVKIKASDEIKEFIEVYQQVDEFKSDDDWVLYNGDTKKLKEATRIFQQKDVADFSNKLKSYSAENKTEKRPWQWRKLLIANGLVACFLVFVYLSYFQQTNLNDIYKSHNSWNELPSFAIKSNVIENEMSKVEQLFKEKKFKQTRDLCLKIIDTSKTYQPNLALYLGVSQLEQNKYDEAIKTFTTLTKSNTIDFHKGHWYKAMVYLKQGKKEHFITELKTIKKHQYYYNNKAVEILNKIK